MRKNNVLKIIVIIVLAVIVLGVGGFVAWASITNPIMPAASEALKSDAQVKVSEGNWLVFQSAGQQPETGLIFYPGGKVDYRAYSPYARAVAAEGYLVIIPHMPLNLAVFDAGEAGKVIAAYPQIKYWAVGGHSLGGSMAANYAAQHQNQVQGLVLLASYPAGSDDLSKSSIKVVSLFGTNDGLATGPKIDASRLLLPASTIFQPIQGGNHAQFGDYGIQSGDGTATISRADQQKQAVTATVDLLKSLSGK